MSRRYGSLIFSYLQIADILKRGDEESRPAAYCLHNLHTFSSTRKKPIDCQLNSVPVLISAFLPDNTAKSAAGQTPLPQTITQASVSSAPIMVTSTNTNYNNDCHVGINTSEEYIRSHVSVWLCIDDLIGSTYSWFQDTLLHSSLWQQHMAFSTNNIGVLFQTLFPDVPTKVANIISTPTAIPN